MSKNLKPSEVLSELAVKGMQEKKAKSIVKIDLREVEVAITDFFVICHADSDRQVQAIADSVEKEVKEITGENPYSMEGKQRGEWVLIDYVDVVVHVFKKDSREFFGIENLWGDGKITEYEDVL